MVHKAQSNKHTLYFKPKWGGAVCDPLEVHRDVV